MNNFFYTILITRFGRIVPVTLIRYILLIIILWQLCYCYGLNLGRKGRPVKKTKTMNKIYNAKSYIEEILLGINTDGIGFVKESAYSHFQKSNDFFGFDFNTDHSEQLVSVGLIAGQSILEIGIDIRLWKSGIFCDCFKDDLCRKLMMNQNNVKVIPKQRYNANLVLNPGNKVGHPNLSKINSFGSLGFFLLPYDTSKNPCIVSNNHVLADTNKANVGDSIYSLDSYPSKIGVLKNYLPITTGENKLDLAVAELQGFDSPLPAGSFGYREPLIGEKVYKQGATTGFTQGYVRSLHYTAKINYGGASAVFVDQIQITTGVPNYNFSEGGDSGSIIKSSATNSLVGLLFAGNNKWTLANHQTLVVQQLKQWGYSIK